MIFILFKRNLGKCNFDKQRLFPQKIRKRACYLFKGTLSVFIYQWHITFNYRSTSNAYNRRSHYNPFQFVATTHALWWNGIKPVFVDIEPTTCNLDPDKIEAAITPRTTAIMPVHVYGKPCNTKEFKK